MMIDATFWVMVSFFSFIGLLIYFKIPQTIKKALEENIKISSLLQAKDEKDFLKKMKDYEKNRTKGS